MKLSKKLIVTGLLFSSVLGAINVGSITAMAGINVNNVSKYTTKMIHVNFVDANGNAISNPLLDGYSIVTVGLKDTKVNTSTMTLPREYKISKNGILDIKDGQVTVIVEKYKDVNVRFVDKNNYLVTDKALKTTFLVKDSAKSVDFTDVELPSNYRLVNKLNSYSIDENGQIKVTIQEFKTVKINYTVNGKQLTIDGFNKTVDVDYKSKEISLNEIGSDLSHYKIKDNKTQFQIDKNNEVTVDLETSVIKPAQETKSVIVYFVDDKGKTVKDGKIEVAESVKTVSSKDVTAPKGYKVVANQVSKIEKNDKEPKDHVIIYVVKDKKLSNIQLVPNTPNLENVTPIQKHKSTIATHFGNTVSLYDSKGKKLKNRALSSNSTWASDKTMVLNGTTYYRVATNEWVKAEDIYEYVGKNMTITTNSNGSYKSLYNSKGASIKNRGLAANSSWATDKSATINGEKMYRVATNEWVKANDIK